jgi:murein DD-endopeptidase MepM/ murein hydrolase activator NlpD
LIVVNHGNGYETYYGHLSGINVFPGQVVTQGSVIGATGNTGRSSGPHLHFEIRYFNSMLEPISNLR